MFQEIWIVQTVDSSHWSGSRFQKRGSEQLEWKCSDRLGDAFLWVGWPGEGTLKWRMGRIQPNVSSETREWKVRAPNLRGSRVSSRRFYPVRWITVWKEENAGATRQVWGPLLPPHLPSPSSFPAFSFHVCRRMNCLPSACVNARHC